jgi:hypothetical protein
MFTRRYNPFLLLALTLAPLGCSATGTRDNDFTPIVSEKARPLSDEDARTASVFPDRLEFPLESQSWLSGITAGDVLVSDHDFGFLRLVTSLENTPKAIVVYTEPAELTDIVEQGATEIVVDYATLEPAAAGGFPGASPQAMTGDPFIFTHNFDGQVVSLGDGVNARFTKGSISFKPSLDIGLSIKERSIVEAHALANGAFMSDLEVEVEGAWPVNITKEVEIWRSPTFKVRLPPIGFVPVACTAWLAVKAGFTFDAKGQMKVTLGQSFDFDGQMGVRYTNYGGWEKVWSFQPNWVPQTPTLGAAVQVDAKGYLGGALNIGFFAGPKILGVDLAGTGGSIEIAAKPYLRLQYDSNQPPPGWGLYSGFQLEATPSLKILHQSLYENTFTLYKMETLRLPEEGANEPAPVDSGNCSDGQEDGVETGVDCGGQCAANCGVGGECVIDEDCTTGACVNGECSSANCDNAIQDADEMGVDCGGSCPECSGGACQDSSDCASGNCVNGACEASLDCYDGVQNGTETDVDCGGNCDPCYGDVPANCFDGELSGDEEQIDCGGSCEPCQGGGGGTCDGTGDCNTCAACAEQGSCADFTSACSANPDCVNLANCVYACVDSQCVSDCYATYPGGDPDFTDYDTCVTCSACFNDCGGANICL